MIMGTLLWALQEVDPRGKWSMAGIYWMVCDFGVCG